MRNRENGFTLTETMAAVMILAFVSTSVWVVLERCMTSTADSAQRMRAFEITRENMEELLVSDSVEEAAEYGISDRYSDIQWQTTVETFSEPLTSRMWAQAICSAEYTDVAGEVQTVELTHWLTKLSKQQMEQLKNRDEELAEHIIETEQDAAEYEGVDVETIRQWVASGMPTTSDGAYLKPWLDLWADTGGAPSPQDKQDVLSQYPELATAGGSGGGRVSPQPQSGPQPPGQDTGLPPDIPEDMVIPPEILKDLGLE